MHTPNDNHIFLDMDGVIAAWSETVYKMHNWTPPAKHVKLVYDVQHSIGITEDQMWEPIYAAGPQWWAELPVYPWTTELVAKLRKIAPVTILTSPCWRGHSALGKTQWLKRQFGDAFRDYVITSKKYLLARPNTVLVDDCPEKLVKFAKWGGKPVLFPRQWNHGPVLEDSELVEYTVQQVREALG